MSVMVSGTMEKEQENVDIAKEAVTCPPFFGRTAKSRGNKEPGEKAVITFGDHEIRDLKELREALQDAENLEKIKEYLDDDVLYDWLEQHYYESEAEAVQCISGKGKDWLQRLAKALKVAYNPLKDAIHQEDEAYEKRKEAVREAAESDESLLPDNVNLVALDQEELARLLDAKEEIIYLCKETFVIPLSVKGIHYKGINHPVIENAFTEEQYQKAGIKIENIELPDSVDEKQSSYAMIKALENGYDPFYEEHSSLANAVHRRLHDVEYYNYYSLPMAEISLMEDYRTEDAAKKAAAKYLRTTYDAGSALFDAKNENCIMKDLVSFYENMTQGYFDSFEKELQDYCESAGKQDIYEKVKGIVKNCKATMQEALSEELEESKDYYEMYKFEYFADQVDIEEFDTSIGDDDMLMSIIETLFMDTRSYSITDFITPIDEMGKDVNARANTFHKVAQKCYNELVVSDIEGNMELLGKELEPIKDKESIGEYLKRMTR